MNGEESGSSKEIAWIPCLVAALISVVLVRSGFLAVFFLAPLGYIGFSFNRRTAWYGALLTVALNALWGLGLAVLVKQGFAANLLDLGYFLLTAAVFTWFIAPPAGGPSALRIRAAFRLIAGSLAVTGMTLLMQEAVGFTAIVRSQVEALSSLQLSSVEGDAVRRSVLEQELNPERILAVFNMVLVRGGALASCMLIFFINRQLALGLAALVRRRNRTKGEINAVPLQGFRVPYYLIWVLSGSLAVILLLRIAGITVFETVIWNLLTVCALMYLAQGVGIVQFFLSRRNVSGFVRLMMNIGIILVVFSPGINVVALGLLALLGIAEHWVPLRVIKQTRPPSTPAV